MASSQSAVTCTFVCYPVAVVTVAVVVVEEGVVVVMVVEVQLQQKCA